MTKLPRDHRTRLRGVVTRQRWKAPSKILKTVESSNCEGTLFHAPDKATHRFEQLGISRDRVLKRFEEWAEGATKLVRVNADTSSRLRANENLRNIFGDGRGPGGSVVTYRKHLLDGLHYIETAKPRIVLPKWLRKRSRPEPIYASEGNLVGGTGH